MKQAIVLYSERSLCVSTRQQHGVSRPVRDRDRVFYKSHSAGRLRLPVSYVDV